KLLLLQRCRRPFLCGVDGNEVPEGGDLLRRRECDPVERLAAGPVRRGGFARPRLAYLGGDHTLREIVDLLETFAAGDGELARSPQRLERGFGRAPAPPATGSLVLEIARHQRAFALQAAADIADHLLAIRADAVLPAGVRFHFRL